MSDPVHDFTSTYDKYAKSFAETNALNKEAVFAALRAGAIIWVYVHFNGAGDSSQIDEITAHAGDTGDTEVAVPNVQVELLKVSGDGKTTARRMQLREAIEELCFDYLSQEHRCWRNNDGGRGDFTFRVEDASIDLEFEQFYTDSTTHSHTF